MAKLKSGTRIYGTATIDTSVVVGSAVTANSSGIQVAGVVTATSFVGALTGTASSTTNIPNLTGAITSVNTTTSLGSFTSAQLATALTDETGSGANVFATSPVLVTPSLGIATATSIVVGSGVTINTSGISAAAGIITATQLSTGASGTGVNITTNTISGPATLTIDPAAVGDNTGAVRIKGDLYVDGTQFIVNSTTIELADLRVGIATTVGTNLLLDGGGIGIGSANILKTITWNNSASALTSSEDWNLVTGKQYEINNTSVLTSTTLGSGVTNSSLTSVGTLGSLNASGIITATELDLTASSSANNSVLSLTGTPTSASGTNGLLGIGTLSFSDTDIIANFTHNVNGYAQVVVQNKNSGASSSADIIVNNDRSAGTTYYGDFGINGTTFSAGGVFGDVDGTYLYSAGGTLSLGSLNSYDVKIATNNTERVRVSAGGSVGIGTTNPTQPLHVQGNARITGAVYDSTNSPGTTGQVLQSTVTGTQWTNSAAGGGSGKFDTTIDNVLYIQPTGTLDIVGVGTTTTQITTLPSSSPEYIIHSLHVTNISNGDAEITAGFVMNARKVPETISVSVGSSGGPGIHTFTVGSASSIRVGMAVTGTGNIGETTGIGSTAGFQFNTYVTSVNGNNITLSKPMSGRATGVLYFSPVSLVSSRLPVPVGSAVELLKQPMVLNALDSIVLQSTGAGTGIGSSSTAAITQAANSNFLTVTAGAAITNFLASGMLIQPTGNNTGIQTNTFVGVGYTPGALSIPMTRPATVALASTSLSFTEVVVPQDGALQVTVVYQSSTDTSYQNGTGTVVAISTNTTSVTAGLSTIPVAYYSSGTLYPSVIQSIRVSNISDSIIYPGGDYPVSVGIGNSDTIFSWLAYNMVIPRNSSIELCEAPKRIGIGQSIFAIASTPNTIEIQVAGKQKTS